MLARLSDIAGDARPRRAQGDDRADQVGLGAGAVLDGPRGGRRRHHLERARPRRQARLDEPAHGLARDPGGAAARGDHLLRHRQQLRHRQRLSDLRGGAEISRARPLRALRLRPAVDRRRQDRLPGHAGGGLCRRRRLRHRGDRADRDRPHGMAADHHDRLPQLPVGRGEAELDAVVRRQFRRHRAGRAGDLCRHRQGLRPAGRSGAHHGRADRRRSTRRSRTRWRTARRR